MHLVLLPGLDGTGRMFAPLLAALPPGVTTTVAAYPAMHAWDYDALEAHCRTLAPPWPFVVVAESFSGPLGVRLAANPPPGLVGVVLVATFVTSPLAWLPAPLRFLALPLLFRLEPPRWLLRWFLAGPAAPLGLVVQMQAAIASVRPAVLACRVRAVLGVDALATFRAAKVPLLYLQARHDRLVGERHVAGLRRARPDLQVRVLETAHLVLQLQGPAAAAAIEAFAAGAGSER